MMRGLEWRPEEAGAVKIMSLTLPSSKSPPLSMGFQGINGRQKELETGGERVFSGRFGPCVENLSSWKHVMPL